MISTDYSTRLFCCYGKEKMGFTIEKPGKRLTPHSLYKTKITLLGYDKTLKWKQNGNNIVIEIPTIPYSKVPCQYAWTLKLEYVE